MKYGQLVIGPAGSGKSSLCALLQDHAAATNRKIRVVNLDPAAEAFSYTCDFDVRELVSQEDVVDELKLGPNGALMYAMGYLSQNMDWLQKKLNAYGDDDYFMFDCPGQIELYSHVPIMKKIIDDMAVWDIRLCAVCCIDSTFISDNVKFISGSLLALSAMIQLELPHINVLTKCDMLPSMDIVDSFLDREPEDLLFDLSDKMHPKFHMLNEAVVNVLKEFSLVSFLSLNYLDDDSIQRVLYEIDNCIQYGEDLEPKCNFDMDGEDTIDINDL